jgi:hypothetical protein
MKPQKCLTSARVGTQCRPVVVLVEVTEKIDASSPRSMPQRIKWWLLVPLVERCTSLLRGIDRAAPAVAFAALLLCMPAWANAQSTPSAAKLNARLHAAAAMPTLPPSVHLPKLPTTVLHTEYLVETNKKGQVTRVRSGQASSNPKFNLMTYGNALQTFIRTRSGKSVAGVFRLTYDYSPQTKLVNRKVSLVKRGGVDPNAAGAVEQMKEIVRRENARKHGSSPSKAPQKTAP